MLFCVVFIFNSVQFHSIGTAIAPLIDCKQSLFCPKICEWANLLFVLRVYNIDLGFSTTK